MNKHSGQKQVVRKRVLSDYRLQIIPSGGRNSSQGWNPEMEIGRETMKELYLLACFLQLSLCVFSCSPRDAAAVHLGPHSTIVNEENV